MDELQTIWSIAQVVVLSALTLLSCLLATYEYQATATATATATAKATATATATAASTGTTGTRAGTADAPPAPATKPTAERCTRRLTARPTEPTEATQRAEPSALLHQPVADARPFRRYDYSYRYEYSPGLDVRPGWGRVQVVALRAPSGLRSCVIAPRATATCRRIAPDVNRPVQPMVPGLASSPNAALLTSSRPPATSRPDFSTGPYSPRSAALRGASLAFVKAPAKPGPPASTYSGPDGAVTAATRAGSRLSSSSVSSLTSLTDQPDHRGGGGLANAPRRTASRASSRTSMQLEREPSTSRPPSTSGLAATRAVARLQPSRSPSRQPGGSRGGPGRDGVSSGTADEASTPSTASLIGMFEAGPVGTRKAEGSRSGRSSPGEPRIKLAKPAMERRNGPVVIESPQPLRATCSHSTPLIAALAATQRMPSSPAPVEPGPVAASRARGATERPRSVSSPRHDGLSLPHASGPKEPLQPAGEPQRPKPEVAERSSSLGSRKPPRPPPARRMHPHMTGESLADAIVASSLASSRAPSPSKAPVPPPTPPPPRHSSKNHHFFHPWGVDPASRTPSPAKGMRQTMRKPAKSDGEEVAAANHPAARHKKNLVKKHPNKHHEGDRKRWRDEVTERERKRYEGVWAANKGVYVTLPPAGPSTAATALPSANDLVSNIIVRDLWRRSRLGDDVLEEIWELVDRQELKALGREEFVVGMWLIDQRLKGRKLPIKVSRSVWDSVRRMGGVTVR